MTSEIKQSEKLYIGLEIVLPTLLIVFIPIGVLFTLFDMHKFDDVFKYSIYTFISSLVAFHLYFWLFQNYMSKNVVRSIDYIYLTVAAFGLLSAADYSAKSYEVDLHSYINQAKGLMKISSDIYAVYLPQICSDPLQQEDCHTIRELIVEENRGISVLEQAPILHNLNNVATRLKNISDRIHQNPSRLENYEDSFDNILALSQRLDPPPFGYKDDFGRNSKYESLKRLGFLLIGSALALRITRVTIELGGWFKK